MTQDPLAGKRVGIIGLARQGKALARWLPTRGASVVAADSKTAEQLKLNPDDYPGVQFMLGGNIEGFLDGMDLLCLSGGVPLDLPVVQAAVARGIPLSNDAQLFLERCPAPVIGITGSAGKTTTTTLVGLMMKNAGYTTWVGGNIGDVLLDVFDQVQPDHRVVMELSSFQLELATVSPAISAITNLTPNHLDRHGTMEAYVRAKANILLHQRPDDIAVLCRDDAVTYALQDAVVGDLVWFSARDMVPDGTFLAGQRIVLSGLASPDGEPHVIGERGDIPLRGEHNVLNVLAACAIAGSAGVAPDVMMDTVRSFQGVPHRLEVVREVGGVTYINDSIATAPERVVAALRSFDEPIVLLAGGRDKKLDWSQMVALALHKTRHIIAFGEAGSLVAETVRELHGDPAQITQVQTLDEAVKRAAEVAQPGDIVLLSPGGTSYDAFVDFAARGDYFRELVLRL
ncbi:MAG: UDP-N-acetylmuramoyl-L-alanine--D-glutamate ligase [Chloroflexota bacterium]